MDNPLKLEFPGRSTHLFVYQDRDRFAEASALKERPTGLVLDLRRGCIAQGEPLAAPGESWEVRLLPTRGETASEQDLDILRRCLLQSDTLAFVGPSASLLAAALVARQERNEIPEAVAAPYRESDPQLLEWLNAYLERHRGTELNDEFVLSPNP